MKTVNLSINDKHLVVMYVVVNELNLPTEDCLIAVSGKTLDCATSNEFMYVTLNDKIDNDLFTGHLVKTLIDFITSTCMKNVVKKPNIVHVYEVFNNKKDPMWSNPFMNFYIYQTN